MQTNRIKRIWVNRDVSASLNRQNLRLKQLSALADKTCPMDRRLHGEKILKYNIQYYQLQYVLEIWHTILPSTVRSWNMTYHITHYSTILQYDIPYTDYSKILKYDISYYQLHYACRWISAHCRISNPIVSMKLRARFYEIFLI